MSGDIWQLTAVADTWALQNDPSLVYEVVQGAVDSGGGGGVSLGETASTAYRGDRGKTAFDHTLIVAGNPHGTTAAQVGADPAGSAATAQAAAIAAAATDATTKADAKVADAINDGTTTVAPSQNAVFDALALTVPTSRTLAGLDLSADRTAAGLRTALSLVPGTDVQAYDADLGQIAAATFANDDFVQKKSGSLTNRTIAQVKTDLGIVDTVADGVLSGQLVLPGVYISGQVNAAIFANFVYAHPFVVRSPRTVSGLRIYVQAAASGKFARLGIINVDTGWQSSIAPAPLSGQPAALSRTH